MSQSNQFQLLGTRRFLPLFITQFLGAFNDNFYKVGMLLLVSFQGAGIPGMSDSTLNFLAGGIFMLPFFLISATAGQLADKHDKAYIARVVKVAEMGIMALGALGFYFRNPYLMLSVVFFMGAHSTFFGPVKYSILPQHLEEKELIGGNALVEMATNVAILLGIILGGTLIAGKGGATMVGAMAILIAFAGWMASRRIPPAPSANKDLKINWNLFTATRDNLRIVKGNRSVYLSILGISWFWYFGATFLSSFNSLTKEILHGNESVVTLLLAFFCIGIGIGSLMCEKLSGHKIEVGIVPLGAIGMTVFGVDMYFATPHLAATANPQALISASAFLQDSANWHFMADLFLISAFGGLYSVPLYALIQQRSAPEYRSRTISGNNIVNAFFMVLSAIVGIVLGSVFHLNVSQILFATAILNAIVTLWVFIKVPEFLTHFRAWLRIGARPAEKR